MLFQDVSCKFDKERFIWSLITPFLDVLVASKRRAARLGDLSSVESVDFFELVQKVQQLLSRVHDASAMTVTVQDGTDAGQTVQHVHCHVMPRRSGDFEHNDMIYTELNKHDHEANRKTRDLSEMISEAQKYRDALLQL